MPGMAHDGACQQGKHAAGQLCLPPAPPALLMPPHRLPSPRPATALVCPHAGHGDAWAQVVPGGQACAGAHRCAVPRAVHECAQPRCVAGWLAGWLAARWVDGWLLGWWVVDGGCMCVNPVLELTVSVHVKSVAGFSTLGACAHLVHLVGSPLCALPPLHLHLPAPADVHTYLPWETEQDNHLLELVEQYTLVSSTSAVQRSAAQCSAVQCSVELPNHTMPAAFGRCFWPLWRSACRLIAVRVVPLLPFPALALPLQEDGRVKWSAVAAQLPGRTDKQCAIRWKALTTG